MTVATPVEVPPVTGCALRPRHTDLSALCERLRQTMLPYLHGRWSRPIHSADRDACLVRYRRAIEDHIRHDLAYTAQDLRGLVERVSDRRRMCVQKTAVIADLFARLAELDATLHDVSVYATSTADEERHWLSLHDFYCVALELAERLFDYESGGRTLRLPQSNFDGSFRRLTWLGHTAYTRRQLLAQATEVAAPNFLEVALLRTLVPTLVHLAVEHVTPWKPVRWDEFEQTTAGWLRAGGLSRMRGWSGPVVRFEGRRELESNRNLFDDQGRAVANVIIAASHRAGFLDFAFFAEALRHIPHGVWINNAFYGPGMARKLARSRSVVPVRGVGRLRMSEAIDRTISLMAHDRQAMLIVADGSQPNLWYGHQMRVKAGARLLADECVRRSRRTGRRTFVVPLTFNDPVAFVRGLTDGIVVRLHPPIELTEPTTDEPYRSVFDEHAINGGDDLLNQLEGLYILESMQPRFGITTPNVLEAVRAKRHAARRHGLRSWLRSRLNASTHDLSLTARLDV